MLQFCILLSSEHFEGPHNGLQPQPDVLCDGVPMWLLSGSYVESYKATLDFDRTFNHLLLPPLNWEDSNAFFKLKSATEGEGLFQILKGWERANKCISSDNYHWDLQFGVTHRFIAVDKDVGFFEVNQGDVGVGRKRTDSQVLCKGSVWHLVGGWVYYVKISNAICSFLRDLVWQVCGTVSWCDANPT